MKFGGKNSTLKLTCIQYNKMPWGIKVLINLNNISYTKANYQVNTIRRWENKRLGISFGSIFIFFPMKVHAAKGEAHSGQGDFLTSSPS